jgi:hypothetical protein
LGGAEDIAIRGLDTLESGDRRLLALLYGHEGWPTGQFDSTTPVFVIPLNQICSRFRLDKDGIFDALARLSKIDVQLAAGVRKVTAPVFRFYVLRESPRHEPVLTYAIPDNLRPHFAAITARLSGQP